MKTYISILRGINVSGQKLIKMDALRELYENFGFNLVKTYIQSGNVMFGSEPAKPAQLADSISAAIQQKFGFDVPVLVLEREELKAVSERNNFILKRGEDIAKLHVTFLSAVPDKFIQESISPEGYLPDEFYIDGKAVYLFCPNGYGNTKLNNNFLEKKLKVRATTRNWKTVIELVKLSNDLSN